MSGANDETDLGEFIQTAAEAVERSIRPEAGAVMTCPVSHPPAETQPLPAAVAKKAVEQKSPAEWAYERIILYIKNFEEQLASEEEVAMGFTGSSAGTLHIQGMGYFAPDLVAFYGVDENGSRTQMVQHVSQLNVMLRALPKEVQTEEPRRIGFKLARDLT